MACKGVVMIGYLHQPVWTKLQSFSGYASHGFFPQPKFNFNNIFKLRKVSHVEGGNSGWNPSFLSFSVPQLGGEGRSFSNYDFSEEADESEIPFNERVLAAFHLDCNKWGVCVEPLSGPLTNFAAYISIIGLRDRIMYLNLTHEGRLSHAYASNFFEIMPYRLDESTDLSDYDRLEKTATEFRPKLIVASAYSPDIDYSRIRKIADEVGAFFMMDMTHIIGFVAESMFAKAFEFCDIVATKTLKSIRGPGGGMIFFKKGSVHGVDLESAIDNNNCYPHYEGGPHNHTIGGQVVCLKDEHLPDFKNYQKQVVANCIALANRLTEHGYKLVSGGDDDHTVLVDLRPIGIDGAPVEKILNMAYIMVNKNLVSGDKNALVSDGISIGTEAMTVRGFGEKEVELIADLIHEGVLISLEAKSLVLGSTVLDFMNVVLSPKFSLGDKISNLFRKVQALAPPSRSKMFGLGNYGLRFYEFCDSDIA